jgi:uncharacterized protein YbjT (DUF2867 family)
MKIAVAGATGSVGRHIVEVLKAGGHDVVPMSRASGVDLITGKGLAEALDGVECVIDAATGPSPDQKAATEFFTTAARNLQQASARAGVRQILVVSIIGIDNFTGGYYAAKVAHEKAMRAGPVPVRIVRAAQFHELVERMIEWGRKGDVAYVPAMRTQLVAARTVAEKLADLATHPSADGGIVEVAGPRPESLVDAARRLSARRGDGLRIEGLSNPDDPDRALYEAGVQLPGPNAILGGPTFQAWLEGAR